MCQYAGVTGERDVDGWRREIGVWGIKFIVLVE
jgi:hypothetical protein